MTHATRLREFFAGEVSAVAGRAVSADQVCLVPKSWLAGFPRPDHRTWHMREGFQVEQRRYQFEGDNCSVFTMQSEGDFAPMIFLGNTGKEKPPRQG